LAIEQERLKQRLQELESLIAAKEATMKTERNAFKCLK
jgi:hypothetical protein